MEQFKRDRKFVKLLKEGMRNLATCADGEPNVVPVAFNVMVEEMFHLTFSKIQNIIKTKRVANERKSSFCCSFFYFYNHKMSLKSV